MDCRSFVLNTSLVWIGPNRHRRFGFALWLVLVSHLVWLIYISPSHRHPFLISFAPSLLSTSSLPSHPTSLMRTTQLPPTSSNQDIVMGPPPLPPQLTNTASQASTQKSAKDSLDVSEKYSRLKRRFFEIEDVSLRSSISIHQYQ